MKYNTFKIDIEGNKALIYTPKNTYFINAIKSKYGGKWNTTQKCWVVPAVMIDDIRKEMRFIYGQDDLTVPNSIKKVDIIVKAHKFKSTLKGDVSLFGIILASAYGRDSGATFADNVVYLKGECGSGGTRNCWTSYVDEGSVIKILDIPEAMIEPDNLPEGWEIDILERACNNEKELLEQQRTLLKDCIAKIDQELKKYAKLEQKPL